MELFQKSVHFLLHAIYAANEPHIGGITTCAMVKVLLYKVFIYSYLIFVCQCSYVWKVSKIFATIKPSAKHCDFLSKQFMLII